MRAGFFEQQAARVFIGTDPIKAADTQYRPRNTDTAEQRDTPGTATTETIEQYKGLTAIRTSKTRQKKKLITRTKDSSGVEQSSRKDIANVFAEFYEQLYNPTDPSPPPPASQDEVPPFTMEELTKASISEL